MPVTILLGQWIYQNNDDLSRWVCALQKSIGKQKVTIALANKSARIAWAMW